MSTGDRVIENLYKLLISLQEIIIAYFALIGIVALWAKDTDRNILDTITHMEMQQLLISLMCIGICMTSLQLLFVELEDSLEIAIHGILKIFILICFIWSGLDARQSVAYLLIAILGKLVLRIVIKLKGKLKGSEF